MRIAINGFGRIGRAFFKAAYNQPNFDIAAINDLGNIENMAYLLKYDSVYGRFGKEIETRKTKIQNKLIVGGKEIVFLSEEEPGKLPWRDLNIDVVVESTGIFTDKENSSKHLRAGAKRVVITAPAEGNTATVLMGINEEEFKNNLITANASCTTNAASPVIGVMKENPGIEKAILNTIHAYTATQNIVDGPTRGGDFLRGRAAGINIIPSSTGAAHATTKAHKDLDGLFDGVAIRVPVACGSLADITFIAKRNTSAEEINEIFRQAARSQKWEKYLAVSEMPLASSDIIGDLHASIIDLTLTRVVGGNLVKVLVWYDNEMGYAYTLVEHIRKVGALL